MFKIKPELTFIIILLTRHNSNTDPKLITVNNAEFKQSKNNSKQIKQDRV